ncbi:MAG: polysaccharide biosynthesis protein PslG [Gaiellaceae bacterium]|nr:polysaccharide biosynthesis protein PslG [Gaiellaceae bacterium]
MKLLAAALSALALFPATAAAAPGLLLGVDDDSLKWYGHTSSLVSIYRGLGVDAVRVTLDWRPGQSFPNATEHTELQRVGRAADAIRVVLAVTGPADAPPLDAAGRASYCGYIANVLQRYPAIRDVAIWTEPNTSRFWLPRKGSATAYEKLLAACWDVLHSVRPGANVIATSAPHAKPGSWYAAIAKAYRSSLRAQPIFDTVGHNAYPETSAEAPSARHANGSIDEGDLDRLLAALHKGFDGSGQPVPGQQGVKVWYLEDGFQTIPTRGGYSGAENDRKAVSEEEQAAQLQAAVELATCQPAVGGFFNFELRDEPSLEGWQSGLVRPDWSAKPSFAAYSAAIARARSGSIPCSEPRR